MGYSNRERKWKSAIEPIKARKKDIIANNILSPFVLVIL
tara:strand:+ start:765 stop:881 length:117 start_codon:yes stop_codon:yes gene_type:complete